VSALGPGEVTTQLAIGCWALPSFARLVRGSALSLREREFVEAARAQGAGALRIMARHVLPHATWPLVAFATLFVARAILIEAALSFLGLGAQPPAASWGSMVASGRDYLRIGPHIALAPASRSRSPCWRSTCSATVSASRSTRSAASSERAGRGAGR
jgi:peptide/nickel transport system permease protein